MEKILITDLLRKFPISKDRSIFLKESGKSNFRGFDSKFFYLLLEEKKSNYIHLFKVNFWMF